MTAHAYDVVIREAPLVNRVAARLGFIRENEVRRLVEEIDKLKLAVSRRDTIILARDSRIAALENARRGPDGRFAVVTAKD